MRIITCPNLYGSKSKNLNGYLDKLDQTCFILDHETLKVKVNSEFYTGLVNVNWTLTHEGDISGEFAILSYRFTQNNFGLLLLHRGDEYFIKIQNNVIFRYQNKIHRIKFDSGWIWRRHYEMIKQTIEEEKTNSDI